MNGKVYLVGAGPGDPGLLTLKGCELLQTADVIVYDALVSPKILKWVRPNAELIDVGKRGGKPSFSQEKIEKILLDEAQKGKKVIRLKGGDPFIFGRGAEEALSLVKRGIAWEVVPGVTSAIAAPAYAGIPLTHRECASTVSFITGQEDVAKFDSKINWDDLSKGERTLVFLMAFSNLKNIVDQLIKKGLSPETLCAMIMWGTWTKQKTVVGNLSNIVQKVEEAQLESPSVFVVGSVVKLRNELNWFEKSPLFGKRVLVTRSREQASTLVETLGQLGAEPIEFPTLKILPPEDWSLIDEAIQKINKFNWIVFTSVNAVKIFLDRLPFLDRDIRDLKGVKIAAIGEVTKNVLKNYHLKVDLCPSEFVSEALLDAFQREIKILGQRFLLPRAQGARVILSEGLEKAGGQVTDLVLYRTVNAQNGKASSFFDEILENGLDWVTFTSSSTVKNFVQAVGDRLNEVKGRFKVASIGPVTSETAGSLGIKVDLEAKVHTIPGLVEAMLAHETS
ncbi:MAG: uroporphyrinogen-III C-methyltransferase [Chlamydiae bacterium]|nr:uroporphyrinogen-III C-methyltransferase [Chlamydiota bacterium]MBI3266354.1 uroporphyrinogen-III C-methyltransferase [Chlamydiota bacterium]